MGDWKPTTAMPALMLQKNMIQSMRKRREKISAFASLNASAGLKALL